MNSVKKTIEIFMQRQHCCLSIIISYCDFTDFPLFTEDFRDSSTMQLTLAGGSLVEERRNLLVKR